MKYSTSPNDVVRINFRSLTYGVIDTTTDIMYSKIMKSYVERRY